jgi:hypothetical protein
VYRGRSVGIGLKCLHGNEVSVWGKESTCGRSVYEVYGAKGLHGDEVSLYGGKESTWGPNIYMVAKGLHGDEVSIWRRSVGIGMKCLHASR